MVVHVCCGELRCPLPPPQADADANAAEQRPDDEGGGFGNGSYVLHVYVCQNCLIWLCKVDCCSRR